MKQKLIVIISIFLIIIFGITYYIYNQNLINEKAFKNNKELESYTKNEITGTELVTLINKAIDINETKAVKKDNNLKYIEDSTNSIKMDIKFLEKDDIVQMESIYNLGIEEFVKYYSKRKFKCTDIKYHNKTKNINGKCIKSFNNSRSNNISSTNYNIRNVFLQSSSRSWKKCKYDRI